MKNVLVVLLIFAFTDMLAQRDDVEEAIRRVTGETEIETIDPDLVEILYSLFLHPIDINKSSRSVLESTGLFTQFQIVSLIDYRSRHGYIMSLSELASVDGFNDQAVTGLSPFISIQSQTSIHERPSKFVGDITLRYGFKADGTKNLIKSTYAIKGRGAYGDKFAFSFALTEPYDSAKLYPTVYTANLLWQHKSGKVIVGDFNARFGQGICVWNTPSFSSLTSPSAFMKKPSGIAPVNSFTGSSALTGLAADASFGRWRLSSVFSIPGLKQLGRYPDKLQLSPILNIMRYGRYGHFACTHVMSFSSFLSEDFRIPRMLTSIDGSCCIKGVNLFGEGCFDWVYSRISLVAGIESGLADNVRIASMIRYLPGSNEHGTALAVESPIGSHQVQVSLDALHHPVTKSKEGLKSYQIKGQLNWIWDVSSEWQIKVRLAERFRTWGTPTRTEFREDIIYTNGRWRASLRADALYGSSWAALSYVETGYVEDKISAYIRCGIFHIDNWEDRIYAYERDAPGNFNVPSFYGRGLWISGYLVCRPTKWLKLYVRGIYKKPGNAELKLYCSLEF